VLCPSFKGATYEKIEEQGSVQWPCKSEGKEDTGTMYLYEGGAFSTPSGKGNLFAAEWRPPMELEDDEYPFSLCTVREVGHYSVRTMTGNCRTLKELEDEPGYLQISTEDAKKLGIEEEKLIRVSSRRGSVITRALVTDRVKPGATYMTYQWWVGACNELTIANLDPISKTPEYKYCAVKVEKIEDQEWAEQFVRDEYKEIRRKMLVENP
jgi:formate dehydrogenase major subunit